MVTKLKTYGEMRALAVGSRGEMSRDLHTLVGNINQKAAESCWREIGAKSVLAARSTLKCMFVNLLGVIAVGANAQMLEDRLGLALGSTRPTGAGGTSGRRRTRTTSTAGTTPRTSRTRPRTGRTRL